MNESDDSDDDIRGLIGSPGLWQLTAEHLFAAALVLWREISPLYEPRFEGISLFDESRFKADDRTGPDALVREYSTRFSLVWSFKLLLGFAFENFLKGLYAAKVWGTRPERSPAPPPEIPACVPNVLPRELKTHNLLSLARLATVEMSEDESKFLEQLTELVEYAGRYPAPAKPRPVGEWALLGEHDFAHVRALVDRLRREYAVLGFVPMHDEKTETRRAEQIEARRAWQRADREAR